MKNKIIAGLLITILCSYIYFLKNNLKIEKEENKILSAQIIDSAKREELYRLDAQKQQEERKNAKEKTYILQKEIQAMDDKCVNCNLPNAFSDIMQANSY